MTRFPPALSALAGALLAWLILRAPSGPTPELAVLQSTIERHERVIAHQARALVQTSAELRERDSVHVRDSLALVTSRDIERPVIIAARTEARTAAAAQAQAGDSLEATLDTLGARVPVDLRPVVEAAKEQHAEGRSAAAAFGAAMQAQVDGQARLLAVTDSALASTEAALSAARDAWGAAARLAETRRVVISEKDQLIEAWKERACTKACAAKKVGLGVGVGIVLKTVYDLVTP